MIPDMQRLNQIERQSIQGRAEDSARFGQGDVIPDTGLFFLSLASYQDAAPEYNFIYPNARDRWLQDIARQESMMAAAIYAMKTRAQTLDYAINGPEAAKTRAENLLMQPGLGDSYTAFVGKVIDDLYAANNGVFIERIAGGSPRAPIGDREILGFAHLDSRLCWRTFDPEFPVIYTNPQDGTRHAMHRDRVIMTADNVQPNELARGVGFCAVDRALQWVRIIRDSTIYREEKVAGRFTRAVGWAEGITKEQLRKALSAVDSTDEAQDLVIYNRIPFLATPINAAGQQGTVKLNLLDLASIPDGFVFKDDVTLYAYILSFCFGVDAREFWPMTSSGATRADASIQHLKSQGKGFGFLIRTLEWIFRQCLPKTVTFEYDFTDDEQDKLVADLHKVKSDMYLSIASAGIIQPLEARALMIADGILDGAILENLDLPVERMDSGNTPDEADALGGETEEADETDLEESDVPGEQPEPAVNSKKKVLRAA